jgi:hypothetical protein
MIQRDQALQRVGCPWNSVQDIFAAAALQAVKCAAECRDGRELKQNIPGRGNLVVNTANLLSGQVLCYAESNPAFPESWQQKETKLRDMVTVSSANPAVAQWLFNPTNLSALANGIRMKEFKVPGAISADKQKNEIEVLLRSGPLDNPALIQAQGLQQQMQDKLKQADLLGEEVPPEAQGMTQQMQQQMQSIPPKISSVQVAQDESENHIVEANTVFDWMNSLEGQKFKAGNPKQQAGYENCHLHWAAHVAMAKKIVAANQPPQNKPPSENISIPVDKMPPDVAAQALAKAGINATPDSFVQHAATQLNDKVAAKALPHALEKSKEEQKPPQQLQAIQ